MDRRAIFGVSALGSLVSSIVAASLFVWPWLHAANLQVALLCLVAPHLFVRFLGLSFLVPGVVSTSLPKSWSIPAAYGDFMSGILAIIATIALAHTAPWALAAVWIFNVVGAVDLLFALFKGLTVDLDPGSLGAGFYILTALVPPMLVSHALIFMLLVGSKG